MSVVRAAVKHGRYSWVPQQAAQEPGEGREGGEGEEREGGAEEGARSRPGRG